MEENLRSNDHPKLVLLLDNLLHALESGVDHRSFITVSKQLSDALLEAIQKSKDAKSSELQGLIGEILKQQSGLTAKEIGKLLRKDHVDAMRKDVNSCLYRFDFRFEKDESGKWSLCDGAD